MTNRWNKFDVGFFVGAIFMLAFCFFIGIGCVMADDLPTSGTITLVAVSGVAADDCAKGYSKSEPDDCNTITCNYRCEKDSSGHEHWYLGACMETLLGCIHEISDPRK